ncbi:MAG: malate dehydrogenase [Bacillota bacterium]|nr:malate dehydrogenase [Bacillota bacterium]
MSKPIVVTITGAAGQIGYSLIFRIAAGELFGKEQPVELRLLDITPAMKSLEGVKYELADCAFNTLTDVVITDDPNIAFEKSEAVFLVGARPRSAGMERKDLLEANAAIFKVQGKAINYHAKKTVKVLVVGNPANTNCYITMKNAPDLDPSCFSAMLRLDHNRAIGQLAHKIGCPPCEVKKMVVWGNHSVKQVPDISNCEVNGVKATSLVPDAWVDEVFSPTVKNRGAEIIKLRGLSSAGSAANAAICHMRNWFLGTPEGDWVTMGVVSDGSYGIPKGYVYGFPVTCSNGVYTIVKGLSVPQAIEDAMKV